MSSVAGQPGFPAQTAPRPAARPARRSPWRWLSDAIMLSRQRQTQREVDRLVSWRNGAFTGSLEREIAERFYDRGRNFRSDRS